jgi:hypothetical protein
VNRLIFFAIPFLAACMSDYKTPTLSGDPASMSGQTLCYRYAYAKSDPAINAEIAARHLDCDRAFELDVGGEGRFYQ